MRFKELSIGSMFRFSSETDPRFQYSGMEKGPWRKTGNRKYEKTAEWSSRPMVCTVGSVNVEVEIEPL